MEELYDRAVAQAKSQDPQHKIRGNLVLNLPNLKLTCSSPYLEIGWSFEFRLKGVIQPWIQRICIRKEKPPADRYAEDVGDHVWFGTGYGKTPHEKRLPNPFFTRPDVSVTPREKGLTLIHITPRLEGEWYYGVDIYFKDTKRRFHKAGWVWTKEKLETVAKDSTLRDDHERDARQRWL